MKSKQKAVKSVAFQGEIGYAMGMVEQGQDTENNRDRIHLTYAVLAWGLLAAVVFGLAFMPLRTSHDEWWHLKTGKWIVEHGYQLPENDVFTYTAEDYAWDNHEWLSQVGMYLLWDWAEQHRIGGWRALIITKALLLVAAYLLLGYTLLRRLGRSGIYETSLAVFLTLIALGCGRFFFWPRPPVISNIFFVFFLYWMWNHRAGNISDRWLFILPPLMILWANLHGGFLLGGVILAAYFAGELVTLFWLRLTEEQCEAAYKVRLQRCQCYLILGFVSLLATMLNPYGYKVYLLAGRVMGNSELVGLLGELAAPRLKLYWAYAFMLALLALGFIVHGIRYLRMRSVYFPALAEWLLLAFFFMQASQHLRHLILFGFVATPFAVWILYTAWGERSRDQKVVGKMTTVYTLAAIFLIGWFEFLPGEGLNILNKYYRAESTWDRNVQLWRGEEFKPGAYPEAAASFLLVEKPPGRLYNRNNIAGYMIWRLSPESYRVFTDSRFDIFGGDFLADEYSIADGWSVEEAAQRADRDDWQAVVEKYGIRIIFVLMQERINWRLAEPESGWALVFQDQWGHLIWVKRSPETEAMIERLEDTPRTRSVFMQHDRKWTALEKARTPG